MGSNSAFKDPNIKPAKFGCYPFKLPKLVFFIILWMSLVHKEHARRGSKSKNQEPDESTQNQTLMKRKSKKRISSGIIESKITSEPLDPNRDDEKAVEQSTEIKKEKSHSSKSEGDTKLQKKNDRKLNRDSGSSENISQKRKSRNISSQEIDRLSNLANSNADLDNTVLNDKPEKKKAPAEYPTKKNEGSKPVDALTILLKKNQEILLRTSQSTNSDEKLSDKRKSSPSARSKSEKRLNSVRKVDSSVRLAKTSNNSISDERSTKTEDQEVQEENLVKVNVIVDNINLATNEINHVEPANENVIESSQSNETQSEPLNIATPVGDKCPEENLIVNTKSTKCDESSESSVEMVVIKKRGSNRNISNRSSRDSLEVFSLEDFKTLKKKYSDVKRMYHEEKRLHEEKSTELEERKKEIEELLDKVSKLHNENEALKKKIIEIHKPLLEKSESLTKQVSSPDRRKDLHKTSKSDFDVLMKSMTVDLSTFVRKTTPPIAQKGDLDTRTRIVLEILETEQKYVTGLLIMLNNWYNPLIEMSKHDPKISVSDAQKVFADGALEFITMLNQKLCDSLEERLNSWETNDCIGDLFDEWAPRLAPYRRYSSKYEESATHHMMIRDTNPRIKKIWDYFDDHSMNYNGLRLSDYLITPVQRIPRYNFLLRNLLDETPEDHPDYNNLMSAVEKISDSANTINETIRQAESQKRMADIIVRGAGFELLTKGNKYRSFVKQGLVDILVALDDRKRSNRRNYELILFNDILVAGNFVSKKSTLSECSLPLQLLWLTYEESDIMGDLISQHFTPLELNKEHALLLKSPETTWLVGIRDKIERESWIESLTQAMKVDKEHVHKGHRNGKFEFSHHIKGIYEGDWYDGEFSGRGIYTRSDGTIFDGHWDHRFKAGFGFVTQGTQFQTGWKNDMPYKDVEVFTDYQFWGTTYELTDRDWSLLLTGAKDVDYKKSETIIEQDVENNSLYRIKTGRCRVEKNTAEGRVVLTTMGPKSVFGDTSVLSTMKVATASVVSDIGTTLQVIEVNILFEVLKASPVLSMRFFRHMAIKLSLRLKSLHAPKKHTSKKKKTQQTLRNGNTESILLDVEFRLKFDLPPGEVPIKSTPALLRGVVRKYGTLCISQNYLCFESVVFGMTSKEVVLLANVSNLEITKKKELKIGSKGKRLIFGMENLDEIHSLLKSLCPNNPSSQDDDEIDVDPKSLKSRKSMKKLSIAAGHQDVDMSRGLTKSDWNLVQQGFKCITYVKDEPIIEQGKSHQRIYQIAKGRCRIEISSDGVNTVVGHVKSGALLGEMSFLEGTAATASVIADENAVDVYVLEGHFINILFVKYPDLAGRFFCYLATVIAGRLNERESSLKKIEEKKKKKKEIK